MIPAGSGGRRERLARLCLGLPEAERLIRGKHLQFTVRGKAFAYYAYNEHNDGRIALLCKALPGEQSALVSSGPERFFVPAYIGPKGWIGLRLDLPGIDWDEVERLLTASYTLVAPRKLTAAIGQTTA